MSIEIAKTILQQMGGTSRIAVMTGTKRFMDVGNGVAFDIGRGAVNGANRVEIILNGKDLYDVTFFRVRKLVAKPVGTANDVYADQLQTVFEKETGMYLSPFRTAVTA
jgi:hypothetical protein